MVDYLILWFIFSGRDWAEDLRWVPMVGEWWSLLPRRAKGAAEASDGEG